MRTSLLFQPFHSLRKSVYTPVAGAIKAATLCLFCTLFLIYCSGDKPIDADTRREIDSTATARIRAARVEMDSQCKILHTTRLPQLVDSIKRQRLEEIEEKMKTVPK